MLSAWLIFVWVGIYDSDKDNMTTALVWVVVGIIGCAVIFYIFLVFFTYLLLPGEVKQDVLKPENAPFRVRAASGTVVGVVLAKLIHWLICCKKES